jgi:hypothetical protein
MFRSSCLAGTKRNLIGDDPDSVIVVFGDHLPMLGRRSQAMSNPACCPDNFGAFTREQYDFSAGTPLLAIDGQNGPIDLGRIPMHRLPSVILRLLGEDRQRILDLVRVPASVIPRPLPDVMMTYQGSVPDRYRVISRRPTTSRPSDALGLPPVSAPSRSLTKVDLPTVGGSRAADDALDCA